ncbi:MAG TPA: nitroreductase family deazaflavin-dependent oxidoreductase [Chloroflexota bacterium]|jgi:deazaflavin-dependent oxidoreductase (nitroreductase family)
MPLPRALARFNRRVTNRFFMRRPAWLRPPGFAVVVHRGRVSGREYRTPISAFRRRGGYVVALTYGPRAEWVRNVLAAGGCGLERHGRRLRLTNPRVVRDPARRLVPLPVRLVLRLLSADHFLLLDAAA